MPCYTAGPRRYATAYLLIFALAALAIGCADTPSAPTLSQPSSRIGLTVTGHIRDRLTTGTGAPIRGAEVQAVFVNQPTKSTFTDSQGLYRLDGLPSMAFEMNVIKPGYSTDKRSLPTVTADMVIDVDLVPISGTLYGYVADQDLRSHLDGAVVQVLTGSNAGRRTTSGGPYGSFGFENVWGEFDVSVSYPGYETATARASVADRDPTLKVYLKPSTPPGHISFTGRLCSSSLAPAGRIDCAGDNYPYPVEASHMLGRVRAGAARLAIRFQYVGDYYDNYLNFEILCGADVIAAKRIVMGWDGVPRFEPERMPGPIDVILPRQCNYRIRFFDYISDRKGGDWTTYRVDVDPPR